MSIDLLIKESGSRTIIFDLDNTIFPEVAFIFIRYKELCEFFGLSQDVFFYLKNEFVVNGRKRIFQKMIDRYSLDLDLVDAVSYFKSNFSVHYDLKVYPWFEHFINNVDSEFIVRIITNGNPVQQKVKVDNIELLSSRNNLEVVYADVFGGKPNVDCFKALSFHDELKKPIYIGDSSIDRVFSRNANIDFLNVEILKSEGEFNS